METKTRPVGRPSDYDPSFCEKAILYIGSGKSKEAFAGHLGIAKDTLYNWIKAHKEFSDAIKVAEAMSQDFWEQLGIVGTTEGKSFNATTWIFNMKNRFSWKDKMELAGDKENPIEFSTNLPDEQLDRLIAAKLRKIGVAGVTQGEGTTDSVEPAQVLEATQ